MWSMFFHITCNKRLKLLIVDYLHNDVVDGDVDEFDKESNEAHDGESNCCCHGNLLEL